MNKEGLHVKKWFFTRFVQLFQQFHLSADGIQFEKDYQDALAKGHQLMEGAYALLEELTA